MGLDQRSGTKPQWGLSLSVAGMIIVFVISVTLVAKALYEEGIFEAKCTAAGGIVTKARSVCVKVDGIIPIKTD